MEEGDNRQDSSGSKDEQNKWPHNRVEDELSKPFHDKMEDIHASVGVVLALQFQTEENVKPIGL